MYGTEKNNQPQTESLQFFLSKIDQINFKRLPYYQVFIKHLNMFVYRK